MKTIDYNNQLLKIQKLIEPYFFSYFKDSNILVISEEKQVLPFAYLIIDPNYKGIVILSLAVDYTDCNKTAELMIITSQVLKISLGKSFYISKEGSTYFNEEAYQQWTLDNEFDLNKIEPINQVLC